MFWKLGFQGEGSQGRSGGRGSFKATWCHHSGQQKQLGWGREGDGSQRSPMPLCGHSKAETPPNPSPGDAGSRCGLGRQLVEVGAGVDRAKKCAEEWFSWGAQPAQFMWFSHCGCPAFQFVACYQDPCASGLVQSSTSWLGTVPWPPSPAFVSGNAQGSRLPSESPPGRSRGLPVRP